MTDTKAKNPLETGSIRQLMIKFAVPSIIAMLVGALYNIVDQLFIGQAVGTLGNAATNIAFPLTISCTALALLFGIGGASNFNLAMGRKHKDAGYYIGNAVTLLIISGVFLFLITEIFLQPMLRFFGSPDDVMGYAMTYVRVTAVGFPFLIITTGGGHLIRADGNPKMAMFCNLSGAVINTILDAVFIFGFHMGMFGAGLATVIGQVFSGVLALYCLFYYKTVKLSINHFKIRLSYALEIAALGTASFFNQIAMMVVQVVLNKSLTHYGSLSEYGQAIPLACAGITTKVNQMFFAIVIGLAQGTQPIQSFNYGAKNFKRVKEAYKMAVFSGMLVSIFAFLLFQFAPRQIISLFGQGSESYYKFGIGYFRVFFFFTFLNFLQPITATFFTSIGKPYKGIFLSLTRQILFLLPLIMVLPLLFGIDGIIFSGPIADFVAAVTAIIMAVVEFKKMDKLQAACAIE